MQQKQAEQEEEFIVNKLMKRLDQLKHEKQVLANEVQCICVCSAFDTIAFQILCICTSSRYAGRARGRISGEQPAETIGKGIDWLYRLWQSC